MAEAERLIEIYQQLEDAGLMVIAGKKDSAELMVSHDVVPVVRCKDCKHLTVYNSPTLYAYCQKTHLRFEPFQEDARTHYCSYGERRTDAED